LFDFGLLQQNPPEGDIDSAMGGKRPPEGGPSLRKESFRQMSTWMARLERTQSACPAFSRLA
jgi:hypothetical protein